MEMVHSIAILGTGSDVGKSVITAGICRILSNYDVKVAPFKAQNMSNNAEPALLPQRPGPSSSGFNSTKDNFNHTLVTESDRGNGWGEIGSAQALQAQASRLLPRVEMNPILLKSGGRRKSDGAYLCNVIVLGKLLVVEDYGALKARTGTLQNLVMEAHEQLQKVTGAEVICIEGAGSCTELNLMDRDIVNLPLVRKLSCPWILVANIDPGGVFAQIVGTKACVSEEDWDLCGAVIVNRLRGERKYFEPGPAILEEMVGKPIFVVPFIQDINLPEEDGLGVERRLKKERYFDTTMEENSYNERAVKDNRHTVIVIAYPHIAITSDLTPLENDKLFDVQWRRTIIPNISYPDIAAIILPGSKLTRSDLEWLKDSPWMEYIQTFASKGGKILGLCGGYQILGEEVADPKGIEGEAGTSVGLGHLPVRTVIEPADCKVIRPRRGKLHGSNVDVKGFELHCGRTFLTKKNPDDFSPLVSYSDCDSYPSCTATDGLTNGRVSGSYLHGIMTSKDLRRKLLLHSKVVDVGSDADDKDPLDKFAAHLESCGLTFDRIMSLL